MYILACAMDRTGFNIICQCKSANDICRILEITHERTNQVKESKVGILANDDEMKIVQQEEEIQEEEVSNMCLMALEDRDKVNYYSDFDDGISFEYDEMLIVLYKFDENNTLLKKKVFELQKELYEIKENFSKV